MPRYVSTSTFILTAINSFLHIVFPGPFSYPLLFLDMLQNSLSDLKLKGETGKEEPNLILFISGNKTIFQAMIIIMKNSVIFCGEESAGWTAGWGLMSKAECSDKISTQKPPSPEASVPGAVELLDRVTEFRMGKLRGTLP